MAAGMVSGTAEGSRLELQAECRRGKLGMAVTLKPTPSGTLPPSRPYLLNLPKQRHQLGTECSSTQDYGGRLIHTATEGTGCGTIF